MIPQHVYSGTLYRLMACAILGFTVVRSSGPGVRGGARSHTLHDISQDTVQLMTITTDTGDLAPGNKDFSRFTAPGECLGAVKVAQDIYRRSVPDQVADILQADSSGSSVLPAQAVTVAHACASQFSVAGTAKENLPDLLTLELMAMNDSLAHQTVARLLSLAKTQSARDSALEIAVGRYLHVAPRRLAAAESLVTQMDADRSVAVTTRIEVHAVVLDAAEAIFDIRLMREQAAWLIDIANRGSGVDNVIRCFALERGYQALGNIADVEYPDSLLAIMARAKHDFSPIPPTFGPFGRVDLGYLSPEQLEKRLVVSQGAVNARFEYANPLPPFAARYWFPAPPTSWPPQGSPTLIVHGGLMDRCDRYDDFIFTGISRGNVCTFMYASLTQWAQRYGSRLHIIFVAHGEGHAVRSLVLSPVDEADSLAWFFRDHLKLPVTVAVIEDSLMRRSRAASIGKNYFEYRDTTLLAKELYKPYNDPQHNNAIVMFYDAQGTLRYAGLVVNDRKLDRIIEQVMGADRTTANWMGKP